MKNFGFVSTLSGFARNIWSSVQVHPLLVSLALVVSLALLWWFRKDLPKYTKALVRVLKPWVTNFVLLVGAVKTGYEAFTKQSDPWAGAALAILFGLTFLWKGLKDRRTEKGAALLRLDDATKDLREEVVRLTGDSTLQAFLYVNRRDVLALEAASRHPLLKPTFRVGEGACGQAVTARGMKRFSLSRFTGMSYTEMVTANGGVPVLNMTADQWDVTCHAQSVLAVPVAPDETWVIGVMVLVSEKPISQSGLDRTKIHNVVEPQVRAMRHEIARIR